MLDAIGEILTPAIASAISVVPILAVVVTLTSKGGRTKAVAFLVAWFFGLVVLTGLFATIGSGWTVDDNSEPSASGGWVEIGLGLAMIALAVQQWSGRPREGEEAETPGWLAAIDKMSTVKIGAVGVALAVANVKNLPLIIGAGLNIAQADLSSGSALVVILVFAAISSLGVATPLVVSALSGEEASERLLAGMREFLTTYNNVIMAVIFLILGVNFIGSGLVVTD